MKTNEELRKDVIEEIKWDPQLQNAGIQINVDADDGVVTLAGLVDTYSKKIAAEKAAQRVHGVKVVVSEITIRITEKTKKADHELADAIKSALYWNSAVNDDQIEVKVENGWVYLDGKVDWEYERKIAQRSVEFLHGVVGVTNTIAIKSKTIDANEIKNNILSAFNRNATVDASTITVETHGHKVVLKGKVRSWAEKKEAEKIVWSSPGVVSIDNRINVDLEVYV